MTMYTVVVKTGETIKRLVFDKLSIEIGRAQGNDIVLDSKRVSKYHAKILVDDSGIKVLDLNSANGTFINGERVKASGAINSGDEIRIAIFVLKIEINNVSTDVDQNPECSNEDYIPTSASLRKLIGRILIMDTDFDAFCLDHFQSIKKRFSHGMDRIVKTSLLLELADRHSIVRYLREDFAEQFAKHQDILIYEAYNDRGQY